MSLFSVNETTINYRDGERAVVRKCSRPASTRHTVRRATTAEEGSSSRHQRNNITIIHLPMCTCACIILVKLLYFQHRGTPSPVWFFKQNKKTNVKIESRALWSEPLVCDGTVVKPCQRGASDQPRSPLHIVRYYYYCCCLV